MKQSLSTGLHTYEIPSDWRVGPVGDYMKIETGSRNTQDRVSDGLYPFYVRSQTVESINSYSFDGEAVLTAGDGVGTGKVFHYINGKFDCHQRVYRMSYFSDGLHGRYFYWFFSSFFYDRVMSMTAKSSVDSVRRDMISMMDLALPQIAEQRRIAQSLDDIDLLQHTLDRLIVKKCAIKQGAMQQLLTGKTRLPGFSGEWELRNFGAVLKVKHGKSQRSVEAIDGPYPILASGGVIGRSSEALYSKPSVLIGRKGTIDKPRFMDTPFWTVDTLFYTEINPDSDPKFLYYKFCMVDWYRYNEASGVPSLNASVIERIEILVPEIAEQQAIAQVLTDLDAEIDALVTRREKTALIKTGMMQELLTGRTRLV